MKFNCNLARNIFLAIILLISISTNVISGEYQEKEAIIVESPQSHTFIRPPETKPTVLVLHYTFVTLAKTLQIFVGKTDPEIPVSSHYTISQEGILFQHVPEDIVARHAGVSYWNKLENINLYSIGIEHVNLGYKEHTNQPDGIIVPGDTRQWYNFDEQQIEKSIELCKSILKRYNISPRNVVGHSDIAPKKKR